MDEKIPEGSRVCVDTPDIQGVGTLVSNVCGYHIRLDGCKDVLYFTDKEVLKLSNSGGGDV